MKLRKIMSIDAQSESVFRLSDAPKRAEQIIGRRLAVSTFYRWASRGVRGVRLEVRCLGGTRYTSEEALQRFFDAVTQESVPNAAAQANARNSSSQSRRLGDLERQLEKEGL